MATRIASAERGGTFWTQALALKTVLDRETGLAPVEVLDSAGASVETAERLEDGSADFGFMAANWVPRAARGERPFAHKLDLRIAAPMNAGPLFFIARADAAIRTVADLAGKRVVFGPEKSGMAQHARTMLDLLGLAVTPLFLDFAAGGAAVETGSADAQLQCPIPNAVMTALSERVAVRVLPYDEGQLERLRDAVPYYRDAVMRAGALRGLERDMQQVGVLNLLVVHARVSDAVAEAVARAVASNAGELARLNPLFIGLETLLREVGTLGEVPLHPGARNAYRALGLMR
ncbi:MAG TPA: TAXI family TRAP transporter solute-binding subunit [Stellaceae bacterium]|nr:TAXI family TRAP transporter solute-binding subunit [Stellaceae bacterium]